MPNNRENFLEGLKAPEVGEITSVRTPFSDRDVYTCLRLMGDVNLERKPSQNESTKLAQEVEATIIEIRNAEKEKE